MRICIVGAGYVGLVTGACLAKVGHHVRCVDVRAEAVAAINAGRSPIVEPGLPEIIRSGLEEGRFRATLSLREGMEGAEVILIAVGTPTSEGSIDLSYVRDAAAGIGEILSGGTGYRTVTVKSTVVPGTTDSLVRTTLEAASGRMVGEFGLCMTPEFLREGCAVEDFMEPDRIVIGQWDGRSGDTLARVYAPFACPVVRTSLRNAEMIKYAANALLASMISFSNQIAIICERLDGVDVDEVFEGVYLDRRLTPMSGGERVRPGILSYLKAGAGYGGSCFPKDVLAITQFSRSLGAPAPLLEAVMEVNRSRASTLADMVEQPLKGLRGRTVAILGLTFKPLTDDLRDSPALAAAAQLIERGAVVRGYDPQVPPGRLDSRIPADLVLCGGLSEAVKGADAVVLATAWQEFVEADWAALCASMRIRLVVDGRNALKQVTWPEGVLYRPIGRYHGKRTEVS